MSQSPVPAGTTDDFAPPIVTQFAVFLDNRVGQLRKLTQIFEGQHLTLCALSVVDATSYAVCRVITSNAILARRLLTRHGFAFSEIDILVVELSDDHSLTGICEFLTQVEVSIHYVYPLWVQPRGHPVMAMYTDDLTFATQILRRRLVTLFGENELGDNACGSDPGKASDLVSDQVTDEAIEQFFDELPGLEDDEQEDESSEKGSGPFS